MARYRRKRPTGKEDLAASAVSLLIGAGAAVASYYVARLLLAREELPRSDRARSGSGTSPAVADGSAGTLAAGAPDRPAPSRTLATPGKRARTPRP